MSSNNDSGEVKDPNDTNTNLADLRQVMGAFVGERDWEQFHSPKNLAMSIAIEAAELMEHFQWLDVDQSRSVSPDQIQQISEELADVLCYGLALANQLEIDLTRSILHKMEKNREKYPADQFRGRFGYSDSKPID